MRLIAECVVVYKYVLLDTAHVYVYTKEFYDALEC